MSLEQKDLMDVKLARPVAVVDLWDLDDRAARLELIAERLEKVARLLSELYMRERTRTWQIILDEMIRLKREQYKKDRCNGDKK